MSEEKIELHTIATYNNKQYELQDLLNNLININLKLQQRIDKAIRMLEINIEIMIQQPSNNPLEDEFVIGRYKDLLEILKGKE